MKYLIVLLVIIGCANVNRESQDYFKQRKTMRHGIIPVDKKVKKDKYNYLDYIDQKAAMRGQKVYEANCYNCHGEAGKGDGPMAEEMLIKPSNLQKVVKHVPFFRFYMKVSRNRGEMPGWTDKISERDLKDLSNYLMKLAL